MFGRGEGFQRRCHSLCCVKASSKRSSLPHDCKPFQTGPSHFNTGLFGVAKGRHKSCPWVSSEAFGGSQICLRRSTQTPFVKLDKGMPAVLGKHGFLHTVQGTPISRKKFVECFAGTCRLASACAAESIATESDLRLFYLHCFVQFGFLHWLRHGLGQRCMRLVVADSSTLTANLVKIIHVKAERGGAQQRVSRDPATAQWPGGLLWRARSTPSPWIPRPPRTLPLPTLLSNIPKILSEKPCQKFLTSLGWVIGHPQFVVIGRDWLGMKSNAKDNDKTTRTRGAMVMSVGPRFHPTAANCHAPRITFSLAPSGPPTGLEKGLAAFMWSSGHYVARYGQSYSLGPLGP